MIILTLFNIYQNLKVIDDIREIPHYAWWPSGGTRVAATDCLRGYALQRTRRQIKHMDQ